MSYQDARGHTVPAGTDQASRQSLLDLSLSIPSIPTVESATAATQHITALADAGVVINASHPVLVWRTDLSQLLSWDGNEWARVGGGMLTSSLSTSLSSTSMSGETGPRGMVALTFTLPARATVRIKGSAHVVPSGNAAGSIAIYRSNVSGSRIATANWHSRNSTNHQFPTCETIMSLAAGAHGLVLGVSTSAGSLTTSFYYPLLSVAYA